MIHKPIFNRLVIFGFMILVGFSLAKGIYSKSIIAVILSIVSLVAGIYCVHLINRMKQQEV